MTQDTVDRKSQLGSGGVLRLYLAAAWLLGAVALGLGVAILVSGFLPTWYGIGSLLVTLVCVAAIRYTRHVWREAVRDPANRSAQALLTRRGAQRTPVGRILLISIALTTFTIVAAFSSLPGLAVAAIVGAVLAMLGLLQFRASRKAYLSDLAKRSK